MVRVALVQVRIDDDESVADRVDRVCRQVAGLRAQVDLVVLPELWPVGAFNTERMRAHAEPIGSGFRARMSALAGELGAVLHAGSFPERHDSGVSNTSLIFASDGSLLATYRKMHLFGFDRGEAVTMAAGVTPEVVDTALGVTGLTTCYDLRFPELYRRLVQLGAQSFVVPAGWPSARIGHWEVLLKARAIENQAVVLGVNCVGTNGGVSMGGGSLAVAADGTVLAQAGSEEQTLLIDIEPFDTLRWRKEFPALKDRRLM